MKLSSSKTLAGLRAGWTWLASPPSQRPGRNQLLEPGRGMGAELVLVLAVTILTAFLEKTLDEGTVRAAGFAVVAAVLTLLRRRFPVPVLIVSCALGGDSGGMILVEILAGWSAGLRVAGRARAALAFCGAYAAGTAVMAAMAVVGRETLPFTPNTLLLSLLFFLAMVVVPGLVGRYWAQRQTLLHALQERNAKLLWERQMIAGQARLKERQRIAQDMHDSLGHQLALIAVHTGALEVDPELTGRQREAVGVLRTAAVSAMHELREVVGILRDGVEQPSPDPVDETGRAARGTAGIAALVEAACAAGNTVRLRTEGEPRPLAAAADHAAYRIVQEALTNAYKHAPGAPIDVALRYEPDSLVVETVNGPPLSAVGDVVSGGQGLTGLRERARLVGGMVHAGTVEGGGFRVAGVLPYGETEHTAVAAVPDDALWQPPQDLPGGAGAGGAGVGGHRVGGGFGGVGGGAGPDGMPVMDWSASTREMLMGELDASRRRGRVSGVGIGCMAAAGGALVLLLLIVGGLWLAVNEVDDSSVTPELYDRIEVGTA
ncbi:sensor histidine kinase, partial [Streptomyces clavuligerus]